MQVREKCFNVSRTEVANMKNDLAAKQNFIYGWVWARQLMAVAQPARLKP